MEKITEVQWFPGHMTRTKRKMLEAIGKIDVVAELVDARIPCSSRNPDLNEMIGNKPRVILLNKCDMADPNQTARWIAHYQIQGIPAIAVDCRSGKGINRFAPTVKELLKERIASWQAKGMVGRTIKVMIVGIPNVGKSSFINRISNGAGAKVEDRPGVTRENRWFHIGNGMEMMDTPGVLWPKFSDPLVGEHLAFTGAVNDSVVDIQHLAARLGQLLAEEYPEMLCQRYKMTDIPDKEGIAVVNQIGKRRGMLIPGGEIDFERASITLLDEFRGGKIGRITLERCDG